MPARLQSGLERTKRRAFSPESLVTAFFQASQVFQTTVQILLRLRIELFRSLFKYLIEKLGSQLEDVNKQITDLKNFNAGEPSTRASGVQLDKRYEREPIEVQIRALEDKKKDLKSKIDALYDEARKKSVEPGDLR